MWSASREEKGGRGEQTKNSKPIAEGEKGKGQEARLSVAPTVIPAWRQAKRVRRTVLVICHLPRLPLRAQVEAARRQTLLLPYSSYSSYSSLRFCILSIAADSDSISACAPAHQQQQQGQ